MSFPATTWSSHCFDTDIDSDAAVTFYWQKDEHTIMSDGHKYKGTTTQTLTIFNI